MKEIIKLSLALGLVGAVAAILLFTADAKTKDAKAAAKQQQASSDLKKVLPGYGNQPIEDKVVFADQSRDVVFYRGRDSDGSPVTAVAGQAAAKGFGGPVQVLVGLELDGRVRKVLVVGHSETPGLGTQVTDRQRRVTIFELLKGTKPEGDPATAVAPNAYLDQFERYTCDGSVEIRLGPELPPVSGATISSNAVAAAVAKIARAFAENRNQIIN